MTQLQHPVRIALAQWQEAQHPFERLKALILASETLMRIDALLLACSYLESDARDATVRDLLFTEKFLTSHWLDLLRALVNCDSAGARRDLRAWFYAIDRESGGSPLLGLVQLRNRDAHDENRMSEAFVRQSLEYGEHALRRCLDKHPDLGTFCERAGSVVHVYDGGSMRCAPFFVPGSLAGDPESVLVYRGTGKNSLVYGSLRGGEYRDKDAYRDLTTRLKRKVAPLDVIPANSPPDILHDRLLDLSRRTVRRLTALRRYRPDVTIDRTELDSDLEAFLQSADRLFLVEGVEGAGKTTWLCRITERRTEADQAVLFETTERLSGVDFPETLAIIVRTAAALSEALEGMSVVSRDGRVLIALDDLGATGFEAAAILSLFRWVENLPAHTALRIVATIRSDQLRGFLRHHGASLPLVLRGPRRIPGLSPYEISLLVERLPCPPGCEPSGALAMRRELARRLTRTGDLAARRPGFAVAILEQATLEGGAAALTAPALYTQVLARDVLDTGPDGRPRRPMRIGVLRALANALLERRLSQLPLDGGDDICRKLVDSESGDRTGDYEALLATGVLAERTEDFVTFAGFSDSRFLAYLAGSVLPLDAPANRVHLLCDPAITYPPALAICAFYLLRVVRELGAAAALAATTAAGTRSEDLLVEMASLDSPTFNSLFAQFASQSPSEAELVVLQLMNTGEARIGLRAAETFMSSVSQDVSWLERARLLRVRGLYELDEYSAALEEIERGLPHPRLFEWRAEILASCGALEEAKQAWETLLGLLPDTSSCERAAALSGLGYVLTHLGDLDAAERCLRSAVSGLERGSPRLLAEALAQLGELLGRAGLFSCSRYYPILSAGSSD